MGDLDAMSPFTCREAIQLQCKHSQKSFTRALTKLNNVFGSAACVLDKPWIKLSPTEMYNVLAVTGDSSVFFCKTKQKKTYRMMFDSTGMLGIAPSVPTHYWYFFKGGKLRGIYPRPKNVVLIDYSGNQVRKFVAPKKQSLTECLKQMKLCPELNLDTSASVFDSPRSIAKFFNTFNIRHVQLSYVISWKPFIDIVWVENKLQPGVTTIHAYRDETMTLRFAHLPHVLPKVMSHFRQRQPNDREKKRLQNYENRGCSVHTISYGITAVYRLCVISLEEFHTTSNALSLCNGYISFGKDELTNRLVFYSYRDFEFQTESSLHTDQDWACMFEMLETRCQHLVSCKQKILQPIIEKLETYKTPGHTNFKRCLSNLKNQAKRMRIFLFDSGDSIMHALKLPIARYYKTREVKNKFKSLYLNVSRDNDLVSLRYKSMTWCNFGQFSALSNGTVQTNNYQKAWTGLSSWANTQHHSHDDEYLRMQSEGMEAVCRGLTNVLFKAYKNFSMFLAKKYILDLNTFTQINLSLISKEMFWSKYMETGGLLLHPIEQSLVANEVYLRKFCRGGFSFSSRTIVDAGSSQVHEEKLNSPKAQGIVGLDINSSYGYAATNILAPCGFGSTFKNGQRQERSQRYRFFEFRATFFTIYQWMNLQGKKLKFVYHNYSPLGLFFVGKYPLDLVGIFEDGSIILVQFDGAFAHGCPNPDCPTLLKYASGRTRKECQDATEYRNEYILKWISETGKNNISYQIYRDCCTPGYRLSELNIMFKAIPELYKLTLGYSSITSNGNIQNLNPDTTFLAVANIKCKSKHLSSYSTEQYGPLFTWKNGSQVMSWKADRFLLTKDYYLYLLDNFDEVTVENVEWALFYKVDDTFHKVYRHFLSMRQSAPSKSLETFFKSVINISCGLYGTNPDRISAKFIRLTDHLPKNFDLSKHEVITLQDTGEDKTDMFVIKTMSLPKHIRTKNNALPVFCAIIEYGKLRLNQLYYTLHRSLNPMSFKLHYAQIDSSIFTFSFPNLEKALAESPYFIRESKASLETLFHPTLPGHFHTEFQFDATHKWKFCTANTCAWAVKTNSKEDAKSKMSSVRIDSETAYQLQMQLLREGNAQIQQARRINKVGGINTKSTPINFTFKNICK